MYCDIRNLEKNETQFYENIKPVLSIPTTQIKNRTVLTERNKTVLNDCTEFLHIKPEPKVIIE